MNFWKKTDRPGSERTGMKLTIPLFPLPNVVLFPKTLRPLHIFEPRYRALVSEAIRTDSLVGMVLLKEGWEAQYDKFPPIETTGCLGRIIQSNRLSDGRYYITLLGLSTFTIEEELEPSLFRRGEVSINESFSDVPLSSAEFDRLSQSLEETLTLLDLNRELSWIRDSTLEPEALVHHWSAFLPFTPAERQFLLESSTIKSQAGRLFDLLLFKRSEHDESQQAGNSESSSFEPYL